MSFWQKLLVHIGGPTAALTYAGVELTIGGCTEKLVRINKVIIVVSSACLAAEALKKQFPKIEKELDTAYNIGSSVVIALAIYKLRVPN